MNILDILLALSPPETAGLALLFAISLLIFKRWSKSVKSPSNETDKVGVLDLKGPPTFPFFGNTLTLLINGLDQIHLTIDSWANTYGDCFRADIREPHLFVSDVSCIKSVLKMRPGTFSRAPKVCEVIDYTGAGGLITSKGDQWKKYRRITAPHFSQTNVKKMVQQVSSMAMRLLKKWEAASFDGKDSDWLDDCGLYALDVGCVVVSGCDMDALSGSQLGKDADMLKKHLAERIHHHSFNFLFRETKKFKESMVRFDATIKTLVEKYEKEVDSSDLELKNNCLLSHIVQQYKTGDSVKTLSYPELLENTKTYILSGADTVQAALGWVLYYVASNKLTQEKIRDEAKMYIGNGDSTDGNGEFSNITWDKICAMKYLEAVVIEALRLHHLTPFQTYIAEKDTEVGNVTLFKGESVVLNIRKSCLSEENFTRASEFWPERWLIAEGIMETPKDINFVHADIVGNFGYGPRNCPGQHLALVEIKVFVALLVLRNLIDVCDNQPVPEEKLSIAVMPKILKLKLQRHVK